MRKITDKAKEAASDPAMTLRAAKALAGVAGRLEARGVRDAQAAGWSWDQIGGALGMTRQSAHTKYGLRRMRDTSRIHDAYHPWAAYIAAAREARRNGDSSVGTDLLLLGLLSRDDIAKVVGRTYGQAREALNDLYQGALRSAGIEADVAYEDVPAQGSGHRLRDVWGARVRLTPAAKRALEKAAKPMRRGKEMDPKAVLVELLDNTALDPAIELLTALGVDIGALRAKLTAKSPDGAAGDR